MERSERAARTREGVMALARPYRRHSVRRALLSIWLGPGHAATRPVAAADLDGRAQPGGDKASGGDGSSSRPS